MSFGGFERALGRVLFASRWLMAPIYLGLALSLVLVLIRFGVEAYTLAMHVSDDEDHFIIGVLGLVDLSLVASLVLIMIFAGYENFVSRIDIDADSHRPGWMGRVSFGDLKLKLMASIVAISAIHLLEDFMSTTRLADRDLFWRAGLHLLFVVSAVALALMDRLSGSDEGH